MTESLYGLMSQYVSGFGFFKSLFTNYTRKAINYIVLKNKNTGFAF